jgi:hypothetical protein
VPRYCDRRATKESIRPAKIRRVELRCAAQRDPTREYREEHKLALWVILRRRHLRALEL